MEELNGLVELPIKMEEFPFTGMYALEEADHGERNPHEEQGRGHGERVQAYGTFWIKPIDKTSDYISVRVPFPITVERLKITALSIIQHEEGERRNWKMHWKYFLKVLNRNGLVVRTLNAYDVLRGEDEKAFYMLE